jgi:hypothetical protein
MSIQSAITVGLLVAKESAQGVLPGGAKLRQMERVSGQISLEKDVYTSARVRSDRQTAYSRHGVRRASGQIRDELSIGGSDFFLEGAVGSAWALGISKTGSYDIDEDGVITATAGHFAGLYAGLNISLAGFADQDEGVSPVIGRIVAVATDNSTITIKRRNEDPLDPAPFAAEVDANVTLAVIGRTLKNGKLDVSYFFETYLPEIDGATKYLHSVGCKIDQTAIDLPTTGLATATYTIKGLNQTKADASKDATPLDPIAGSLLASVNGAAFVNGERAAFLTAFNFTIANAVSGDPVVGSNFVPKQYDGKITITGAMTVYLQDMKFIGYFDDEQEINVFAELAGDDGESFLNVIMGRVKINSATITADGQGGATIAVNYEALLDPKSGCMIAFQSSYVPA